MTATVTLLAKARQGRRAALASLGTRDRNTDTIVSIFADAWDAPVESAPAPASNVIAFRSARRSLPAPAMAQTERLAA